MRWTPRVPAEKPGLTQAQTVDDYSNPGNHEGGVGNAFISATASLGKEHSLSRLLMPRGCNKVELKQATVDEIESYPKAQNLRDL